MNYLKIVIFIILINFPVRLYSQNNITPFTNFGRNTLESFTGYNSIWLAAAITSTYLIVESDADYNVHDFFSRNINTYDKYTTAALWGGYIAPLAVGGGLYLWGRQTDDYKLYTAGCAALQAAGIAQLTVTVLKAFTGRPNPDPTSYTNMKEASRVFKFGFLRGGLHYGWPSGHLAVNSAVITSLMTYYNKSLPIQIAGVIGIGYLVFGVTAHEGATMHWFSDVVAGTIMGCVIGSVVGKDYREMSQDNAQTNVNSKINLIPILSSDFKGIQIRFQF
jgi:membrane-associated phospholipid phosphatase